MNIQLTINGKTENSDASTLAELIDTMGYHGKRIAVEINKDIIPRSAYDKTLLQPHDQIEIVHAIGGGSYE